MNNFILFFSALLLGGVSYSQTGPGGVGSSSENAVWLDAWKINQANGSQVTSWVDESGNSVNFDQGTSSKMPIYNTSTINGMPGVVFDGADDALSCGAQSALDNPAHYEIFCVTQSDDVSQAETIFALDYAGNSIDRLYHGLYTTNNNYNSFGRNNSTPFVTVPFGGPAGSVLLHSDYDVGTNVIQTYLNGSAVGSNTANRNPGTLQDADLGTSWHNAYYYDGTMTEFIIFTSSLNALEKVIVENYLGAKYGITIPSDFYAFESTHNVGVIGIGDDGTNTHTDSQGNTEVRINTPSDLQAGEYMFVGHDNVQLTSFNLNTNVPSTLTGSSRFVRQWRVDKTGDPGTVTVVFDLDASNNFSADPANYRLLIDSDSDMSGTISQIVSGTYNAGDETVTFTGVNFTDGDFFTLCGDSPQDIHSIANGNWGSTSTWDCTCIPSGFNNVFVDPGHNVTVDEDAFTNNFTVESTGTLTMDQEFTLSVNQDWTINGNLAFTAGEVEMMGSTAQTIDAGGATSVTLHDMNINNSGGATITLNPAEYVLEGLLSMTQGTLNVDNTSGGILIINSTSATTGGRIGPLQSGTSITGNVTARRFIPAGVAGWRDLASPVIGADFTQWDPDLEISCPDCPDGCAYDENGCFHSIRYYVSSGYSNVTSISFAIENGRGYEAWVGDDLTIWSGGTLSQTGTVHGTSDVAESVSSNWQTKGNPFVCPIDFDNLTFSGVGQYFYIYDPVANDWQWYDKASGTASTTELDDGHVAIGQGIWVKGPGTLTFPQSSKVTTQDATYIRTMGPEDHSIYVTLSENASTNYCKASIQQHEEGTDGLDEIDIYHLEMPEQTGSAIAFQVEEELVRKTYLQNDFRDKRLPMYVNIKTEGYYTISVENQYNFSDYYYVYLIDKQTNEFVDLKEQGEYVFYGEEGIDNERFVMLLTNTGMEKGEMASYLNIETETGVEITQLDHVLDVQVTGTNLENVEISLVNTLGQIEMYFDITTLIEGSNIINIPGDVSGVKILTINNNGRLITKKLVF